MLRCRPALVLVALVQAVQASCATSTHSIQRADALAQLDRPGGVQERVAAVVGWLHAKMPWVATDYRERTVDEILARGAGNCADHARVLQSILESRGIRTRWVREINIQSPSESRQARAERQVAHRGLSASVFGRQHNDHRWLEIWDDAQSTWFPADSALGIIGSDAWTRTRLGFGERLGPVQQMLVPFFVAASVSKSKLEDRSEHYLVDAFDAAYSNRLRTLSTWPSWKEHVLSLAKLALRAFRGEVNLHEHDSEITSLLATYAQLQREAQAAGIN